MTLLKRLAAYILCVIWLVSAQVNVDTAPLFTAPDINGDTVSMAAICADNQYALIVLLSGFS